MNIEHILKKRNDKVHVCKIELTLEETKAIMSSLKRTSCEGEPLTISMELEDKLGNFLELY